MLSLEDIIEEAIQRDASDIHIICGLKPVLRIKKSLIPSKYPVLTEEDIYGFYDFIVKGSIENDDLYKRDKRLDTAIAYKNVRLRVNISKMDDIPLFTLRIIKNELPRFEDLGVPDVIRRMTYQPQGVILVTGKTNSGKTTTLNCLINDINENQNRKILTLEAPVEYKHKTKKSIIVQKEVGVAGDSLNFHDGVRNALREDCDILVIGTLHTKSCAETLDRIINFYEFSDQAQIKYLMAALLKIIVSQRLIKSADETDLVMVPEVMVVDNVVAGCIRKEKFSVSEVEDAIQSSKDKGSQGLISVLAELTINGEITLEQAQAQIEEKNYETLEKTIMQLKSGGTTHGGI